MRKKHKLPRWLEPYLPSYDISKMDLYDSQDKREIIEAVLNQGNMEAIKWLAKTYNLRDIKRVLKKPSRGIWQEDVLNYWTKILNIKLPDIIYKAAIFSLEPRWELMKKYFRYMERTGQVDPKTLKIWQELKRYEKLHSKQ